MRPWNADELGLIPDDYREIAHGIAQHRDQMRIRSIAALWGKPISSWRGGTQRGRTEYWTFWRAVRCTIGLILGLDGPQDGPAFGEPLAYFDSWPIYGGWNVEVVELRGWFGAGVYNDGETSL